MLLGAVFVPLLESSAIGSVASSTTAVPTDSSSWSDYHQAVRARVDAALAEYTDYPADCPARLAEAIRHSLLSPGKRLRPLLVLMAAEACGCAWEQAMPD